MHGVPTSYKSVGNWGLPHATVRSAYHRAVKRMPKADVAAIRKLEAERIADLRQRIWAELAGRPDPNNPTQTIRPAPEPRVVDLVDKAIKIARHEAMMFGADGPTRSQTVLAFMGQAISDEELERQSARLTPDEQRTFLMLLQKLQGTWVEPPNIENRTFYCRM